MNGLQGGALQARGFARRFPIANSSEALYGWFWFCQIGPLDLAFLRCEAHSELLSQLGHSLSAGADVKFFVDAADISIDSRQADVEAIGDFLVEITASQQVQHLSLARGELRAGRGHLAERLNDLSGDVAGHRGAAVVHVFEGLQQFLAGSLLE